MGEMLDTAKAGRRRQNVTGAPLHLPPVGIPRCQQSQATRAATTTPMPPSVESQHTAPERRMGFLFSLFPMGCWFLIFVFLFNSVFRFMQFWLALENWQVFMLGYILSVSRNFYIQFFTISFALGLDPPVEFIAIIFYCP